MFNVNFPEKLETQSYNIPQSAVVTPPPVSMMMVKPSSYQFQVVEYMKDDKIVKVELQVQKTTHDEYGNVMFSSGFIAVPRVQLPFVQ